MAFDWRKRKRPQGLCGLEPFSVGLNPLRAAKKNEKATPEDG